MGLEKSTNLSNFSLYPFSAPQTTVAVSAFRKITSTVVPGKTPWRENNACASQREGRSSIRRTCLTEKISASYAFAAKASSATCDGSPD